MRATFCIACRTSGADFGFQNGRGQPQVSTCLSACGPWSGQVRQDCGHDVAAGRKTVYIDQLVEDWRTRPSISPSLANTITLDPADGLAGPRRSLAAQRSAMPARAPVRWRLRREHDRRCPFRRPRAATGPGSRATTGSSTRTALTPAAILAPHRARTLERTRFEPVVLCLQDGTDLIFASRPGCLSAAIQNGGISAENRAFERLAVWIRRTQVRGHAALTRGRTVFVFCLLSGPGVDDVVPVGVFWRSASVERDARGTFSLVRRVSA